MRKNKRFLKALQQTETTISAKTLPQEVNSAEKAEHEEVKSPETAKKRQRPAKDSIWWDIIGLLIKIGWIVLFFGIAFVFFIGVTVNRGVGMMPSFHDGDVIIYYRLAHDFQTDDVVVYEGQNGELLLGRVVAHAGDTIDITQDGVKINGYHRQEENTIGETVLFENGLIFPITLSERQYIILCDNRTESMDSRTLGIITSDQIKGHVMLFIRRRNF